MPPLALIGSFAQPISPVLRRVVGHLARGGGKYDAWASASYVLLNELQNNLAMIPSLIMKGKKLIHGIAQLAVLRVDIVLNTITAQQQFLQLLKELWGVCVATFALVMKGVTAAFWILQAFYALMLTVSALVSGEANLERTW